MQGFKVSGMSCAHCVRAVTDAVKSVDAESDVQVDLESGRVVVRGTAPADRIAQAIREEGYEAEPLAA